MEGKNMNAITGLKSIIKTDDQIIDRLVDMQKLANKLLISICTLQEQIKGRENNEIHN